MGRILLCAGTLLVLARAAAYYLLPQLSHLDNTQIGTAAASPSRLSVPATTRGEVAKITDSPSSETAEPTCAGASDSSEVLLLPEDFHYLGVFGLPQGDDQPIPFACGGNAMTFNPEGDPAGPVDGFPGSLFIMGHDRLACGELPDGNLMAEVSIP
jgi:hypothetical protein